MHGMRRLPTLPQCVLMAHRAAGGGEAWDSDGLVTTRGGLHAGDYGGAAGQRAARLRGVAAWGQLDGQNSKAKERGEKEGREERRASRGRQGHVHLQWIMS